MNLRDLLAAARAAGWAYEAHAGWLGREHTWTRGDSRIHIEDFVHPAGGGVYTELTITHGKHEMVKGRVASVNQIVALLAAYDITVPAPVATRPIDAFKQRVEAHRAAGHPGGVGGCKSCPTPTPAVTR